MAKLVLDHVAGFCQLQQKTSLWVVPGQSSSLKKHSTVGRRISNLPFTELYSPHNDAVMHWPLAHCLKLNFCLPLTRITATVATRTPDRFAQWWARSSHTKTEAGLYSPPQKQTKKTQHSDHRCLTSSVPLHISGHEEHRGCVLDSLIHSHPQSCPRRENEKWKPPHEARQQFTGFSHGSVFPKGFNSTGAVESLWRA